VVKVPSTCAIFPNISDAKVKTAHKLGKFMFDKNFETKLNSTELAAWKSFKSSVRGFLRNKKEENYSEIVQNLLQKYQNQGRRLSLKIQFLPSHLSIFPENLGDLCDVQGEQFPITIQLKWRHDINELGSRL
jgi:hypothetical protein